MSLTRVSHIADIMLTGQITLPNQQSNFDPGMLLKGTYPLTHMTIFCTHQYSVNAYDVLVTPYQRI